ncbi:oligopeptide/dipeptide ABC transporter ATP-binding protein [Pelagovum pacificum]|uniref:ABC transporter ATP-binding protein n=1 Tax=Pelagovum pacificum TaxID=2588711 RepID=A0A5C5GDX5_9RHOB|nr:oligopeptide/dipeptide ABC transporter ATP-binding protein [Pelagovum pacificum]QQA44702.1 ABC transporter ATP-binding protein [Pelagovum pacificum]TNY32189.1 ABC transporter ATP-binding protein [Pelagovum pacificum]
MSDLPVLSIRGVSRLFTNPADPEAMSVGVRGVSFEMKRGETLGLIGESGCGKSTLGRCIVGLDQPDEGDIRVNDTVMNRLSGDALRRFRRAVQIVFQRPETCLNPRMTVRAFVSQALRNFKVVPRAEEADRLRHLTTLVGLDAQALDRHPHQLSGGERQRVAIMRALACDPDLIVLDEPTSALDVSVQAQVLRTLRDLKSEVGTSFLFISHDMAVVRYMCERVMVMYMGRIVEEGPTETVLSRPAHPYTRALFDAAPRIHPRPQPPVALKGELSLRDVKAGECALRSRCPFAVDRCRAQPPIARLEGGHRVACWRAEEVAAGLVPETSDAKRKVPTP